MMFLFRREPRHVFITADDPGYRYEVLCGHCDYPLEAEDDLCPRCQRSLEDCPVCRYRWHKKAAKVAPHPQTGAVDCPVCRVRRLPLGRVRWDDLEGSFCTNIYGCPAGGLMLRTGELALLPADASLCPICRHEKILPRPVRTFLHHLHRCLFCFEIFREALSGSGESWNTCSAPRRRAPQYEHDDSCLLCGRHDDQLPGSGFVVSHFEGMLELSEGDGNGSTGNGHGGLRPGAYRRVVELARSFVFQDNDRNALQQCFDQWFKHEGAPSMADAIQVGEVVKTLLCGTFSREVRHSLQARLDRFTTGWTGILGLPLTYTIGVEPEPGDDARPTGGEPPSSGGPPGPN